jgi:putative acetyltransferase
MPNIAIREATSAHDVERIRELFREYQATLSIDLCFQGFNAELAGLPGAYAPPAGVLLIAEEQDHAAGCVAVRPLAPDVCELKRLYVRARYRGTGLGRRLAIAAMTAARRLGYGRIRLDTLPEMQTAQRLYESLGFYDIPVIAENSPVAKRDMEARLTQ